MAKRKTADIDVPEAADTTITASQLDKLTSKHIAGIHLGRIFNDGDPGEQELVLQLLHLLHARKYSLDPDDVTTRYSDFTEQMAAVFRS